MPGSKPTKKSVGRPKKKNAVTKKKSSPKSRKKSPPKIEPTKPAAGQTIKPPSMTHRLFQKKDSSDGTSGDSVLDSLREQFNPDDLLNRPKKEKVIPEEKGKSEKAVDEHPAHKYPKGFVLTLLELPFEFATTETGVKYEIDKKYKGILEDTGAQVLADFGPEVAAKWINLAMFLGVYGFCIYQFYKALQASAAEKKKKITDEKRQREIDGEVATNYSDRSAG